MNASELADYLLNFIMTVEDYDESKHENASTMLRQQQAEIEALKADNEQLCKALLKATKSILRKAQEE